MGKGQGEVMSLSHTHTKCNIFIGKLFWKIEKCTDWLVLYLCRYGSIVTGRDSSVSIASYYGLDGPGIRSQWRVRFSTPVQTGPGAHPASYAMGTRYFPGVKQLGHDVDNPPPSSADVKERVDI